MSKKSVMIIDDSKYIIGLLERFFCDELDFNVVATALHGDNAIELYQKYTPDLVTLDLSMPNKSGMEVLTELLQSEPRAKVIIISAVRGESIMESLLLGAKGYIEKPLKLSDSNFKSEFIKTVDEATNE